MSHTPGPGGRTAPRPHAPDGSPRTDTLPHLPDATPDPRHGDQHRVWETIAESFDQSRDRTWPHVLAFLDSLPHGSRVLDLMAGNGRHTGPALARGHAVTWLDWSRPQARTVQARYPDAAVVVADATRLPLADSSFDACLYVAGLHSIPTTEGRAASLQELHRVLRPGGRAQVTVWSREAPRFRDQGTPGTCLDVELPWRSHGHDEVRTYHLYTRDALVAAAEAAGFTVEQAYGAAIVSEDVDNEVVEVRTGPAGTA